MPLSLTNEKGALFFLNSVCDLLSPLSEMNVPIVWVKGAATALICYTDFGARPINHFERWIPVSWRGFVYERLSTTNWSMVNTTDRFDLYEDKLGRQIYIWWKLFNAQVDEAFQNRLCSFRGKYAAFYFLEPCDQLIHLCAYQSEWDRRSSLLWIVDAAHLLKYLGRMSEQMLTSRLLELVLSASLVKSGHVISAVVLCVVNLPTVQ